MAQEAAMPGHSVPLLVAALLLAPLVAVGGPGPLSAAPVMVGAAAAVAAPGAPCFSSDHGNPVLQQLTVNRSRVDVRRRAQTVVVDAILVDTGGPGAATGVQGAHIHAPNGTGLMQMRHLAGDLWRARLQFPRLSRGGVWTVTVWPFDNAGNPRASAPAPLTRQVRVQSAGDRRAPVLTRFGMSRSRVDVRGGHRRVFVTVDARDARSGVSAVTLSVERRSLDVVGDVALHRVSGTAAAGRWRGHFDVPLWAPGGRWAPGVTLVDRIGHSVGYGSAVGGVTRRPRLPVLRVRSGADRLAPVVTSITASVSTLDLRSAPGTVAFDVRLRDVRSGVASASAWIEREFISEFEVPLRLVEGTRADGVWRGTWTAATCGVPSGLRQLQIVARDRAGNALRSPVGPPRIDVVNDDHQPPFIVGSQVTDTDVTVSFSEDVVGVSQRSMVLFDVDRAFGPGPQFAGHWTCRAITGPAVDCLAGPVREASFVADQLLTTSFHQLTVNPEHVLDVTDLAGNPYFYGSTSVGLPPKIID
jgi:hypothetical protein